MGTAALSLIIGSSLCWALFDLTRKLLAQHVPAVPLVGALTAAQVPLFWGWVALEGTLAVSWGYVAPGAATTLLNSLALLSFIRALAVAPLSATVPLLALTPVFTAVAAIPLLGEWPSPRQSAGIALTVAGALLLASRRSEGAAAPREGGALLRGRLLMVAVAAIWAVTGPIDKIALRHAPLPFHGAVQVTGISAALLLALALRRRLGELRQARRRGGLFAVAVVSAVGALGMQLMAFRLTLVSLVETVKRAVGMVGSVVSGRLVLGERLTALKLLSVLVMAVGVALILL